MQPKNKSDRTKAFLNFLLLFALSMGIIITTVFFSIQVPVKQANDLRSKMHKVEKERVIGVDFLNSMSEIMAMLDSINSIRDPEPLDGKIKDNILALQTKAEHDTVYDQRLYQNIVKNMWDLQKAKQQLRLLTSNDDKVKELENENAALQKQVNADAIEYNRLLIQSSQRPIK